MYIVVQTPADFDIFTFESLWYNPNCHKKQAKIVKKELEKSTGEKYIQKAEKLLRIYGFEKVDCMKVRISYD